METSAKIEFAYSGQASSIEPIYEQLRRPCEQLTRLGVLGFEPGAWALRVLGRG